MPYGTIENTFIPTAQTPLKSKNAYPGGSQDTSHVPGNSIDTQSSLITRHGTNTIRFSQKLKGRNPASGHYELRAIQLPLGPKTSRKAFDKRKGHWYFIREPITVMKQVWVRNKVVSRKREKQKLNLSPNALEYRESKMYTYGDGKITGTYDPTWYREIEGPLWYRVPSLAWPRTLYDYGQYHQAGLMMEAGLYANQVNSADTKAISKLYEKAKNQQVNLGQVFAERRQTLRTVVDILTRITSALSAIKKGNPRAASKHLFPHNSKDLAKDHLMIQYGLLPLLSDLDGIVKYLSDPPTPPRVTIRAKGKTVVDDLPVDVTDKYGISCRTTVKIKAVIEVTYVVTYELNMSSIRPFTELGLTNLASLAYELTPWSFVLDWLIPIGDYINNLDAFDGLKVVSCHKTTVIRESTSGNRQFGGRCNDGYNWSSHAAGFISNRLLVKREVNLPLPTIRFPEVKDPASLMHVANALALIRTALR